MFGIRDERLDRGHGSPYDRGSADSYYSRTKSPHYYKEGSYTSIKVCKIDMTDVEVTAYLQGYNEQEKTGAKKEWG